jgi:AraC family transcriptional regulator of adaptative response/methylated-DNA-[protein]-cysteine methyltransferase
MRAAATCVFETVESPVGPLVVAAVPEGVCLVEFSRPERLEAQMGSLRKWFGGDPVHGRHPHLDRLRDELDAYFAGTLTQFTVPLMAPGTPFQERVWAELLRIPYGQTRSYEELAGIVSSVKAQRAVGRANGTNRIAIVIPCHRVVNKNGKLGGYGGLLWRKEFLLKLERRETAVPAQGGLFADS